MSLGFVIVAHRLPTQLLRLVRVLARDGSPVVIHLDRRTASAFDAVRPELRRAGAVEVISEHAVRWGHVSQIDAALAGLAHLLTRFPDVSHAKLLSGQDYPIRPLPALRRMLAAQSTQSFCEHYPLPNPIWTQGGEARGGLDRVAFRHLWIGARVVRLPLRVRLPTGLALHGGSALWCLARPHAEVLLEAAPRFRSLFRHARCADELFVQTVLLDQVPAAQVVNDGMTFLDWPDGAPSPSVLGVERLPAMLASGCWFARKFDETLRGDVLDRLDSLLDAEEPVPMPAEG